MARKKLEEPAEEAEPAVEEPVQGTSMEIAEEPAEEAALIESDPESVPAFVIGKPVIDVSELQAARVCAVDEEGHFFYLEPARRSGEYILRVVPQS